MFGDGAVWVSNGPTDLQVITLNQDACIGPEVGNGSAVCAPAAVSVHGETLAMVLHDEPSSSQWS